MKYGFIGTGNMAQALIKGMVSHGSTSDFLVFDLVADKVEAMGALGAIPCAGAQELIAEADLVVLAIKPNQAANTIAPLQATLAEHHPTILSIMAGVSVATLDQMTGGGCPIVRIVPNISAEIGGSVTGLCTSPNVSDEVKAQVISDLEKVGTVVEIDEGYFDVFTVIASSAPAFVARFAESLVDAALRDGLPAPKARQIVTAMLAGTAKTLEHSDSHVFIERICSPGGTTIAGLTSLTAHGFEASIHAGVDDALKKMRGA